MIKAVIFDLDGLLIDSEPFWRQAHVAVLARHGYQITEEDVRTKAGMATLVIVSQWGERFGWSPAMNQPLTEEIFQEVLQRVRQHGEPMPGAQAAVRLCKQHGYPLAVASSSPPELIAACLAKLDIGSCFDAVHSATDEKRSKPFPDVFLTVAEKLGVQPSACAVFEDSLNGVKAAKAAGMYCITVPQHPYDVTAFSIADRVLGSLAEVTPELMQQPERVARLT